MDKRINELPDHLRKYVVDQNYEKYTPEDQAVWRYTMRQLRDFLAKHAHECYIEGLKKTGIPTDHIPHVGEMNKKLAEFDWGAVPVSGFIPPAAFMEFQSRGILPIASDMRTIDHLLYTPAPDIVHEAAGHAPILIDPKFAAYLKKYAAIASQSIISKEDLQQYEAIRVLSDLKEDPSSTAEQINEAESHLTKINESISHISEAALLSRMNWWTAEYGLIGDLNDPKIFGAGLLSSVGEARSCLKDRVEKIPLSVDCVETGYDITEPQPQLFVTPDFETLHTVLDELAEQMAFRRGGEYGLKRAIEAQSINTVQLNSGLQISGILESYTASENKDQPVFLKFSGPTQLSYRRQQLNSHGKEYHSHGYSTPLGCLEGWHKDLSDFTDKELEKAGLVEKNTVSLRFASGILLNGFLEKTFTVDQRPLLLTFSNCMVRWNDKILFDPSWGTFDMATGSEVPSVFGGPADRISYGDLEDFVASRVPIKKYTDEQKKIHKLLADIRSLREQDLSYQPLKDLAKQWMSFKDLHWLAGVELVELSYRCSGCEEIREEIVSRLKQLEHANDTVQGCIEDGLRLAAEH